jgi:hypothetical protein
VSADPALEEYMAVGETDSVHLPGLGGGLRPANLSLSAYAHLSPLTPRDPDGRSTWGAHNGGVTDVKNDGDLGVYQSLPRGYEGPAQKIGETYFGDSFSNGRGKPMGHVNVGIDITGDIEALVLRAQEMSWRP